jgi:hypothetical protein
VAHHARTGPGEISGTTISEGPLVLDPPGIEVNVEAFFASV